MKKLINRLRNCFKGNSVVMLSKEESNRMKRRCVRWE
nr:MAG TPA: hypothetical protein [Caudoviricetes sp.]